MSDQHDDVGEYRPGYTDQVDAAIADAQARTARHAGPGRQAHSVEPGHLPPALAEMERRLLQRVEQLVASRGDGACPHIDPEHPSPMNWLASQPQAMLCDPCARPVLARFEAAVTRCDLCCRRFPHDDLRRIHVNSWIWMIHTALCAECFPEGTSG
jgi:hypothetical protein